MSANQSDTPMTDAEARDNWPSTAILVDANFARDLERDRARLIKALKAITEPDHTYFGHEANGADERSLYSTVTAARALLRELGEL